MNEEWRAIPGFDDRYEISSIGRFRRVGGRVRKLSYPPHGYATVGIRWPGSRLNKTFRVHRLVAAAFIRPPIEGEQVNHKNYDRSDNRVENLEWCTPRENLLHAAIRTRGKRRVKITDEELVSIRERYGRGEYGKDLAREFGVARCTMTLLLAGVQRPPAKRPPRKNVGSRAGRYLSPEHVAEIAEVGRQGVTIRALASRFGLSKSAVHRVLRGEAYAQFPRS